MIQIRTNIGQVAAELTAKMKLLRNDAYVRDKLIRTTAESLAPLVAERIHGEGKKADGSDIGQYSNAYMRTRERFKREPNTKIIFSLTRKMENEFGLVGTQTKSGYGLGFRDGALNRKKPIIKPIKSKKGKTPKIKDVSSSQKAEWLEQRFGKVYALTTGERAKIQEITDQFIKDVFN